MFLGRCKKLEFYLPVQIMEKAVIIFADNTKLAEFIIKHQVSNAEANSREQSLIAPLEDEEIITACTEYGGHLNVDWLVKDSSC